MHRSILVLVAAAGVLVSAAVPALARERDEPTEVQVVLERVDTTGSTSYEVAWLTPPTLERLRGAGEVAGVLRRDEKVSIAMAQSVPFVGAPGRWAAGARGAGKVIVVIDTGVSPFFGGSIVGQACFVGVEDPLEPGSFVGRCGPDRDEFQAFSSDCFTLGVCDSSDPDDVLDEAAARPCEDGPAPECDHGSAVAAVAARSGPTPGVAPDAGVYAIQVFDDPFGGYLFDIYLALEHVVDLVDAGVDVAAVNLSVATEPLENCDANTLGGAGGAFQDVMRRLGELGVATTVAAGNDRAVDALGFPSCLPEAVAVGATDLADELTYFTNRGSGLDLFAPGARAAADPDVDTVERLDIPISGHTQWSGTSFSAPHVAGAFALLSEEYPKTSMEQRLWFLRASGVPISTGHGPVPRLQMREPAEVLLAEVMFPGAAPIAGTSRQAVGDFDFDGRSDVLAHAPGLAPDHIAYGMATPWAFEKVGFSVSGTYTPIVGNFVGTSPGPDDVLWYAPGAPADSLWAGKVTRGFDGQSMSINGTYAPHVGDFDDDGWDDIFWYAPGPSPDSFWFGGPSAITSVSAQVSGSYRISVGDVNGDGNDDILFHGPGDAPDNLWRGTDARGFVGSTLSMPGAYTLISGNFDGDVAEDVVLYQPGPGADFLWRGNSAVGTVNGGPGGFDQTALGITGTYAPVVGDLNGDGRDDIVWYAAGSAPDAVWFGEVGGGVTSRAISVTGTYRPLVGNLDGDAGDDIVWFNPGAIDTPVWWSHVPTPAP